MYGLIFKCEFVSNFFVKVVCVYVLFVCDLYNNFILCIVCLFINLYVLCVVVERIQLYFVINKQYVECIVYVNVGVIILFVFFVIEYLEIFGYFVCFSW